MSRGRLFGTLRALSFLVHLGRVGFAPLAEPLMAPYVVGPGTAGLVGLLTEAGVPFARGGVRALAIGLVVLGGAVGALYATGPIPGSPTR